MTDRQGSRGTAGLRTPSMPSCHPVTRYRREPSGSSKLALHCGRMGCAARPQARRTHRSTSSRESWLGRLWRASFFWMPPANSSSPFVIFIVVSGLALEYQLRCGNLCVLINRLPTKYLPFVLRPALHILSSLELGFPKRNGKTAVSQ